MLQKQPMADGLAAGEPLEDYTKFNTEKMQVADDSKLQAKVSAMMA